MLPVAQQPDYAVCFFWSWQRSPFAVRHHTYFSTVFNKPDDSVWYGKKERSLKLFLHLYSLCLVKFWGTVELVHSVDQCLKWLLIDLFSLLLETERDPYFLILVMHWKDFLFFNPLWIFFSNVGHTLSSHLEIKLCCKERLQLMSVRGSRSAHFLSISARLLSCRLQQMLLTQQIFLLYFE